LMNMDWAADCLKCDLTKYRGFTLKKAGINACRLFISVEDLLTQSISAMSSLCYLIIIYNFFFACFQEEAVK